MVDLNLSHRRLMEYSTSMISKEVGHHLAVSHPKMRSTEERATFDCLYKARFHFRNTWILPTCVLACSIDGFGYPHTTRGSASHRMSRAQERVMDGGLEQAPNLPVFQVASEIWVTLLGAVHSLYPRAKRPLGAGFSVDGGFDMTHS